jgi:hypothetical protein
MHGMEKILCLLVMATLPLLASAAELPQRPNVVLIISDDHAWTDYAFMGHTQAETPHLYPRLRGHGHLQSFTRYHAHRTARPSAWDHRQ